ncbi:MAG TPA: PAS domain S-box protein, partial [Thermoanaerobaculia bacterium]|nr:PAS domain S-box protein [Thermoanaerobaculia bacterium]
AERRALADAVDFHEQLLAAVEQAVVAADRTGRLIYCNDFFEGMFGHGREEVLGTDVMAMVAPRSLERGRELLDSVLRGESWSGEAMARRKDGSEFRAFATVSPLRRDGEIVGAVCVAMDMSPFDEAQEAVRMLAARQHALLRAVPDRILTVRRDGTFVDFRQAAPLADSFPGTATIADAVPPGAAAALLAAVERAFAAGRVETVEYDVEADDGRPAFEARIAPIDGEEVVAVIRDVTERRRQQEMLDRAYAQLEQRVSERTMELAHVNSVLLQEIAARERFETELRESHRRLQVIIDASPSAIIELDHELRIVTWNPAAERIFGWTAAEAIGQRHLTMPPGDLPELQLMFNALLRGGSVAGMEVPRRTKDGRTIVVNVSAAPLREGGGRIRGILFIVAEVQPYAALTRQIDELGRHLATLDSVTLALARSLDVGEIVAALRQALAERLGIGSGAIYLPESDGDTLLLQSGWGDAADGLARLRTRESSAELARSTAALPSIVAVPLPSKQRREGVLVVQRSSEEPFTREQVDLLRMIALEAGIAIENARLFAEVREANERLQSLSRRLLAVQEEERRHIGRELHDQIGQMLTALKLMLDSLQYPDTFVGDVVERAGTLIDELFASVRGLSLELRPPVLDDAGLVAALLWHVERYQQQTRIPVEVRHAEIPRLSGEVETAAFRIAQEALTNVARHSGAASARVLVWAANELLMMQIEDDGDGFDVEAAWHAASGGLSGMRERATLLGGRLTIDSTPGRGTTVSVELPAQRLGTPA